MVEMTSPVKVSRERRRRKMAAMEKGAKVKASTEDMGGRKQ